MLFFVYYDSIFPEDSISFVPLFGPPNSEGKGLMVVFVYYDSIFPGQDSINFCYYATIESFEFLFSLIYL